MASRLSQPAGRQEQCIVQVILDEHPRVPYFSNHGFRSSHWRAENGVPETDAPLLAQKTKVDPIVKTIFGPQ